MSVTNVRKSGNAELRYGYVDLHTDGNNFCIPEPTPQRLTQIHSNPPFPSSPITRRSCARRFCCGICSLFTRVKKFDELEFISSCPQTTPSTLYCPSGPSRGSLAQLRVTNTKALEDADDNDDRAATSKHHLPLEDSHCEEDPQSDTEEDCGEYIIYIPKVSRTLLERNYLQPLRKASFDPIVIQPPNFKGKRSSSRIISNTQDDRKERRSRQLGSKLSLSVESEETLGERLARVGKLINGSAKAYGEYDENDNSKEETKEAKSDLKNGSKSKMYLYIPVSSSKQGSSFMIPEKKISWAVIHERHSRAARNKQRMLQKRKEKCLMYFAIWDRRRLIGDKKKRMSSDIKLLACSPPNMLESRFHHIHWLGNSGKTNNSVGRYFDKEENIVVALKIFGATSYESILENLDNKLMAIQEITSLKKMDHRNIIKLMGYFEFQDKYHVILESCDHSLRCDIEEAPSGLGTCTSKKIIRNILNGLNFCHQLNCLHRDLCPENILVCKDGTAKIADFDRSVFLSNDGVGSICPTPGSYVYDSPEILAGDKEYGLPSDVWSLGVIFCELLTGQTPWNGKNMQSQLREIHDCVGPLLPRHAAGVAKLQIDEKTHSLHNHGQLQQMFTTISAACCSFIKKCLDVDPQSRFTCRELLQHPFIKGNYK